MKTPPFLLLAALMFWGWLSGFLIVGTLMGVVLEAARFINFRWDLDDADFSRIWSFCILLNVVLAVYVFTANSQGMFSHDFLPADGAHPAMNSGVFTATRFLRWLPLTMFVFVLAQFYNARPSVPLTGISIVLRWRRRKGDEAFTGRYLNIAFPYFLACLFSAGIHTNLGNSTYYWGSCGLGGWALWAVRPTRFNLFSWLALMMVVFSLGFGEVIGFNRAQEALQNLNAQWLSQFFGRHTNPLQTMTAMGRIGRLKLSARIVIWLQPSQVGNVPTYLREASYRNYQPRRMAWFAGDPLNDFEWLHPQTDSTTWPLIPGKHAEDTVNITCFLNGRSRNTGAPQGLLPLPTGCSRLENMPPDMILKKNGNGDVLASGQGLVVFNADYGPGATMDAPPDLNASNCYDLDIPTNEVPALKKVIPELHLPLHASYQQKLQAVRRFFFTKFTYTTYQGRDKLPTRKATPLTRFLLTSRSGHCEYFASATVLLLRELGIPARYAVGYYVHEARGSGYIVRDRDAHAWCLAWDAAANHWENFDTTPPSWVAIEDKHTSAGEWLADVTSWFRLEFARFRWGQTNLRQYIFWALIPVLLVLLYHIIFRRLGKLRAATAKSSSRQPILWPGLDSEFYQLEQKLAASGVPRQKGEPLSVWLERALSRPALANLRVPLQTLLQLHYRHRFDPQGLNLDERNQLRREAKACLDFLLQAKQAKR